jgi:hypothetical protein
MKLSMTVWGDKAGAEEERLISWEDMTNPNNFEVKFEATDPAEDDRKLLTGLALLRVPGVISKRTFREKFAGGLNLNNEEEEEQVLVEMHLDIMGQQALLMNAVLQEEQAVEEGNQSKTLFDVTRAQTGDAVSAVGQRERTAEGFGAGETSGLEEARGDV